MNLVSIVLLCCLLQNLEANLEFKRAVIVRQNGPEVTSEKAYIGFAECESNSSIKDYCCSDVKQKLDLLEQRIQELRGLIVQENQLGIFMRFQNGLSRCKFSIVLIQMWHFRRYPRKFFSVFFCTISRLRKEK